MNNKLSGCVCVCVQFKLIPMWTFPRLPLFSQISPLAAAAARRFVALRWGFDQQEADADAFILFTLKSSSSLIPVNEGPAFLQHLGLHI